MHPLTPRQLADLCAMLEYKRPHGSGGDELFRTRFLKPLGCEEDIHGNLILKIGESPILWSSHTDTVHRDSGFQTLRINESARTIRLSRRSRRSSNCLGADDTAGCFIMREMILASVPGLYIFHYGEESGGLGSGALAWKTPETLDGISFAIALDRAGTADIITSQGWMMGGECCSKAFVSSLAGQLPGTWKGARGVYTDTAEYQEIVPECTNLSVGYYLQHTSNEWIDYAHVGSLLRALCHMDQSLLVCDRDPSVHIAPLWSSSLASPVNRASHTSVRRDSDYGWDSWCARCEAPVLTEDEIMKMFHKRDYVDYCMCVHPQYARETIHIPEYDADTDPAISEDDRQFLRYLKGL